MSGSSVRRNANGQLLPGSVINPRGHNSRGLSLAARLIYEAADVDAARRTVEALSATKTIVVPGARGDAAKTIDAPDWHTRLAAVEVINNRVAGRPRQAIDLNDGAATKPIDMSQLTDEELKAYEILMRAKARLLGK
jgi:hypothetical protein